MTRKDVESLFKTYYTQMYHLALTLLFDEAESKDVVSEVFANLLSGKTAIKREQSDAGISSAEREQARPKVKAAIKREQSDAGISSAEREQARPKVKTMVRADNARAFLLASVRHRSLNVLQHKQVKERFARLHTEDSDTLVSSDTVEEQLQMEELMRYLQDCLPPMSLEIFRLRYLQEMTCLEVAAALNVSRQTVHVHLKQTVERIRKYFATCNPAAAQRR
ncbi:MAG: sigma-70 family RNA polymerase sigma factor [Bacteroidaceae bacterium]|nr:sigma-70 family RNA polymerase sigma factor [Bacteroidaceae bacterium]